MSDDTDNIIVRNTTPDDFKQIIELTKHVYPDTPSWTEQQLLSHHTVFPEGQFVTIDTSNGNLVGMSASLIVQWDDYDLDTSWRDFTDSGYFTNHDPESGRTLYGAEIMVDTRVQGKGIGTKLYNARQQLVYDLELWRIRAGARLRDYHLWADKLTPQEYVNAVVHKEITDRTLTFQLNKGFNVLYVVSDYLRHDPESLGYAAVIERLNDRLSGRLEQ